MLLLILCGSAIGIPILLYTPMKNYESSNTMQIMKHLLLYTQDNMDMPNTSWSQKLNQSSKLSLLNNQVVPVILKMPNLTEKIENKAEWTSSFLFAFHGGCKFYLRVNAAGQGDGEGNHVSMSMHNVEGPHDEELQPLVADDGQAMVKFTVELFKQQDDVDHYTRHVSVTADVVDQCAGHIFIDQFISHGALL